MKAWISIQEASIPSAGEVEWGEKLYKRQLHARSGRGRNKGKRAAIGYRGNELGAFGGKGSGDEVELG